VIARWKDLCLDADDPSVLGDFWAAVIGLEKDVSGAGDVSLVGPTDGHRVWVNEVQTPKRVKHRLHLDVYATSPAELVALGARVVLPAEESGFGWTVMTDPEGGEFCCFVRDPTPGYRLHGIVIDCRDPGEQARWWGQVFGLDPVHHAEHGWWTLEGVTPDEVLTLDFVPVPEGKQVANRVHWDVVGDRDELVVVGATHRWDTRGWTVLADPEGNEFCVFAP
jgi:predicted enzyme related to lactoylglutathione lyase